MRSIQSSRPSGTGLPKGPGRKAVALLLAAASATFAAGPVPLPSFNVKKPSGEVVSSQSIPVRPVSTTQTVPGQSAPPPVPLQWLLIYASPNCVTCAKILAGLNSKDVSAQLKDHVVVIVGDLKAENVKRITKSYPWIPDSTWYLDATKEASKQLALKTDVLVLGMRDNNIMWRMAGAPAAQKTLSSIVKSWILPPGPVH
jgi:hypothetical protein